jgi:glycerol-3-phosphate acyltransferase PlsY
MEPHLALLAAAVGYFVGAISFTRVVAHFAAPGADFSRTTYAMEKNQQTLSVTSVNATALALRAGPVIGMLTGILDMLKFFIPTLVFRLMYTSAPYFLIVAAAGMAGHVWPVYYRFRGGRGISQVYGGMLAIDPLGAVVCGFAGPILGLLLRDTFITFIGGMWLLIPWLWFTTHDWRFAAYAITVNLIFILASLPEMREYLRIRRSGASPSFEDTLQTTPMGKGLYKMGQKMHLVRSDAPSTVAAVSDEPERVAADTHAVDTHAVGD